MTDQASPLGDLVREADRWSLRFVRSLPWPPTRVWQAVTTTDGLAAWFPDRIEGSWEPGAPLRFVQEGGTALDGRVLTFEPERLVEFVWGTDVVRIELAADATGTTFTLTHVFDERGKAARDAAGWHVCLDDLARSLQPPDESTEPPPGWEVRFDQYRRELGPEASSILPPGP